MSSKKDSSAGEQLKNKRFTLSNNLLFNQPQYLDPEGAASKKSDDE